MPLDTDQVKRFEYKNRITLFNECNTQGAINDAEKQWQSLPQVAENKSRPRLKLHSFQP